MAVINTNLEALNANRQVGSAKETIAKVMERLASGKKINKAADNAAALAIAEALDAEVGASLSASRASNDAVSLVQVRDAQAGELNDMFKRMKELSVQASSETLGDQERGYLQDEFNQLNQEAARISRQELPFGNTGADTTLTAQAGTDGSTNSQIAVDLSLGAPGSGNNYISGADISTVGGAQSAMSSIDTQIDAMSSRRATFGAAENRFASALRNLDTQRYNTQSAMSQIRDADFATETAAYAGAQFRMNATIAVQSMANLSKQSAMRLL